MKYLQDILVIMKDKMLITQFKNLLKDAGFSVNLCLDLKKLDDNFDYKAIFIDVFSQEAFWQKHKNNISEFDRVFVFLGNDNKILPKLKFANPIYLPFAFQSFFDPFRKKIEGNQTKKSVRFGNFTFFPIKQGFYKENVRILGLTELETKFLIFLIENKQGATKSDILFNVWGHTKELDTHALESLIYRLRKKFENKLKKKKIIKQEKNRYIIIRY